MTRPASAPTVLSALVARGAGIVGRSHRLHRPRGGFCARGYCQQCPLVGDSLACETPVAEVRAPRPRRDPLRLAGLVGERMEPWFYERRFLRPRALRQPALEAIRRLSAAPRLPAAPARPWGPGEVIECDVLVVGGGPAGIGAAAAVVDASPRPSVVVMTSGPAGGGARAFGRTGVDVELGAVRSADVRILDRTRCLGLYEEEGIAGAIGRSGPISVRFERLVVATGAYDRPLLVPGADIPGVVGVRAFERLAAQGAVGGRRRVGLFGAAAEVARAAAAADAAGVTPAWVAGPGELPAGLPRAEPGRQLAAIEGRRRVRSVVLDDDDRRATDLLVLGFTQPTYELQLHGGRGPVLAGSPVTIGTTGTARWPTVAVGEAAGFVDPEEALGSTAERVRAWLAGGTPEDVPPPDLPAPTTPPSGGAVVCVCEDVRLRDLDRCVADGLTDVELFKRRSGAGTGACQGKLCLGVIADAFRARSLPPSLPTVRPPIRPVAVAALGETES